jgi:hypothetical protein
MILKVIKMKHIKKIIALGGLFIVFPLNSTKYYSNEGWTIVDGPETITLQGQYKLARNITAPITIQASNVTLDLASNTINGSTFGIIINPNLTDIVIRNGNISNSTVTSITANQCQRLEISNINFLSPTRGVFVFTSTAVVLSDCNFFVPSGESIAFSNITEGVINNCFITDNTGASGSPKCSFDTTRCLAISNLNICNSSATNVGLSFNNCSSISGNNISIGASQFTAAGIIGAIFLTNCSEINFDTCSVLGNRATNPASTFIGISATNCNDIFLEQCLINSNSAAIFNGYAFSSCKNVTIGDSAANMNNLSATSTAFLFNATNEINLDTCQALNNITLGNSNFFVGVSATNCNDILLQQCLINSNTAAAFNGYVFSGCKNINITNGAANLNNLSATSTAFLFNATNEINLDTCQVLNNNITLGASVFFAGISGSSCNDIVLENCLVNSNTAQLINAYPFSRCTNVNIANSAANTNNAASITSFFSFDRSANIACNGCFVESNAVLGGSLVDFNIVTCTNIVLSNCFSYSNTIAGTIINFFASNSNTVGYVNCQTNKNFSNSTFAAFQSIASSPLYYKQCLVLTNSTNSAFNGFTDQNVNNLIYDGCQVNNNIAVSDIVGFNMTSASIVRANQCVVVNNNSNGAVTGFNFNSCSGIVCDNDFTQRNVAAGGSFGGFFINSSRSGVFENCIVDTNTSLANANMSGFAISASNGHTFKNCFAVSNTLINSVGTTPVFSGFIDDSTSTNNIFDSCRAVGNGSNADCHGFQIRSQVGSVINCIAQGNTCAIGSIGFWLNGARAITVRGNLAESAFGPNVFGFLQTGGSGIAFTQNQAQGFIRPPGINQNYSGVNTGAISTYDLVTYTAGTQLPASFTNLSITVT